jgi:23S rRNA (pseudouridine1915-N3)-methyltransferase
VRLRVIAVGGKMPGWVSDGVAEFSRRLPRELRLDWRDIPLAHRGKGSNAEQLRVKEGEKILEAIAPADRVIALDVRGRSWSTAQLAQQMQKWLMSGDNYSLLIGGPDGLSEDCLARADQRWSLSDLTLPHPLVRIILAEQLYRAWTINTNHPYHRE